MYYVFCGNPNRGTSTLCMLMVETFKKERDSKPLLIDLSTTNSISNFIKNTSGKSLSTLLSLDEDELNEELVKELISEYPHYDVIHGSKITEYIKEKEDNVLKIISLLGNLYNDIVFDCSLDRADWFIEEDAIITRVTEQRIDELKDIDTNNYDFIVVNKYQDLSLNESQVKKILNEEVLFLDYDMDVRNSFNTGNLMKGSGGKNFKKKLEIAINTIINFDVEEVETEDKKKKSGFFFRR